MKHPKSVLPSSSWFAVIARQLLSAEEAKTFAYQSIITVNQQYGIIEFCSEGPCEQ